MGKNKNKDKGHVRAVPEPADEAGHGRNPGMPLVLDWVRDVRINRSAIERRAATIPTRRSVKKQWQAAWLLKAITKIARRRFQIISRKNTLQEHRIQVIIHVVASTDAAPLVERQSGNLCGELRIRRTHFQHHGTVFRAIPPNR